MRKEEMNKAVPPQEQPQNPIQARAEQEIAMLERNEMIRDQLMRAKPKIGREEVMKASETMRKYKEGKVNLEAKIIANEEFWKLRQWNAMHDGKEDFKPATAWLWSCIQSRYSDAMDSYPTCNLLPRQADDKPEAKKLSSIIPIILEQNRYEETYSDVTWYMLKHGGCAQGIFWDGSKHNGLGDIAIKRVDLLNLFWESGITDIQESENIFHVELVSDRLLEQKYPQCAGKLGQENNAVTAKYLYDDKVDTKDKSLVVDWYYHTEYDGRKALQYVKYVNDIVLYATENEIDIPMRQELDPETGVPLEIPTGDSIAVRGLYDHGLYPFVVQPLYPIEGSVCGYGLTDIGRDTQLQIDKLSKAVTDNAIVGATPRYFIKNDGAVNEKEYADVSNTFVHVEGNIGEENIRPVDTPQLAGNYVEVLNGKIEELKYVTSNQDANNGVTPTGVTAASAIAALQETAGKNARSSNKTFYRAYRNVVYQVIELVRQFYDMPRTFRISPEDGSQEQYVTYDNRGLRPQPMNVAGEDMGLRVPEFDIEVTAEKENPYKKMEINELALNFYNLGFFNPQMADQALACLQMMDFNHKEEVMQRIQQNGTIMQMMLQFQQIALMLAQKYEPMMAQQLAQMIVQQSGGTPMPSMGGGEVNLDGAHHEHAVVANAREQAATSTEVR